MWHQSNTDRIDWFFFMFVAKSPSTLVPCVKRTMRETIILSARRRQKSLISFVLIKRSLFVCLSRTQNDVFPHWLITIEICRRNYDYVHPSISTSGPSPFQDIEMCKVQSYCMYSLSGVGIWSTTRPHTPSIIQTSYGKTYAIVIEQVAWVDGREN
jgi:hypothetical protein